MSVLFSNFGKNMKSVFRHWFSLASDAKGLCEKIAIHSFYALRELQFAAKSLMNGAVSPEAMSRGIVMCIALCLIFASPLNDAFAAAQATTADQAGLTAVICNAYLLLTGDVMRIICAFIVISSFVLALMGKISMSTMLILVVSIGGIFASMKIVGFLSQSRMDTNTCGTIVQTI